MFTTEVSASHWRLVGLDLGMTSGVTSAFSLVTLEAAAATVAALPHHLVVDRCYIHGHSILGATRGIQLGAPETAIIESYISEMHHASNDAQAIGAWNCAGPQLIHNNYLVVYLKL